MAARARHREVGTDVASFSAGLRDALRQRPDVLMVGEVRDAETADTVLHAGESGHLVFGTLHTSSALAAIHKMLAFFPLEQRGQRAMALADAVAAAAFAVTAALRRTGGGPGRLRLSQKGA